jgi:Holliday junction resolvasome RuvABC endonuclease subunit
MASNLMLMSRQIGRIEQVAIARAVPWREMPAASARLRMLGHANASDAEIGSFVARTISGWPKRSNVHARDAAMVALAAFV